jgi:hypothetical protein
MAALTRGQSYALYLLFGITYVEAVDSSGNPTEYSISQFRKTVQDTMAAKGLTTAFWDASRDLFGLDPNPRPNVPGLDGISIRLALSGDSTNPNIPYQGSGNPCPNQMEAKGVFDQLGWR